jgi:DNA-binding NtrC family response regulator
MTPEALDLNVLLVGEDAALLEGLSQSFAGLGYRTHVTTSLHEAREIAADVVPLLAVVSRELAATATSDALAIKLAAGGALVLFHETDASKPAIPMGLQRSVMADLALPLERNRLIALAQHVQDRARTTGRSRRQTPPEVNL